jgi:hypothetical protein
MTRRTLGRMALFGALLTSGSACSETTAATAVPQVGFVAMRTASTGDEGYWPDHFPDRIVAPDTVHAGVEFTARVTTLGASGCFEAVSAEVQSAAALAVVTPYDRDRGVEGYGCTGALKPLSRNVALRFDAAGTAVIQLRGRVLNGVADEPILAYERSVTVLP